MHNQEEQADKMRILFFCTFYHRAMLFRQQMDALISRGHDVVAFNTARYGEGIAEKFRPLMDEKVVHVECWNKLDRMLFFPRQWKIERQLMKHFDVRRFDLIHAHLLLSTGYSARRIKQKYNIPYVVTVRVTDLTGFIRIPYFRAMANRILSDACGILFLSASHKEELLRQYIAPDQRFAIEEKSCIIGNCLEPFWTQHRVTEGRSRRKSPDEIRVLSVAKIRPVKNLTVAAQAVQLLRDQGINATLTIVGENQDPDELAKIQAFSCVHYIPFMTKDELIQVYADHDLFLLPSINETFGRVYIEAMSQGLPVLYTRGQGFDGNFPDGEVGYAVPHNDPSQIADRILKCMEQYAKLSASGVEKSRQFDEDVIMDRLEQFYMDSMHRCEVNS